MNMRMRRMMRMRMMMMMLSVSAGHGAGRMGFRMKAWGVIGSMKLFRAGMQLNNF